MSKSGKVTFYIGKLEGTPATLKKGKIKSLDHFRKDLVQKAFAMRFAGKTDEDVIKWLEAQGEQSKD